MKIPYIPRTLLLNVLLVLTIIACIWVRKKDLITLEWILNILLFAQIVFRWPWLGPRL